MEDFQKHLGDLLKRDGRFEDENGDLLKQHVIETARRYDEALISLLLSDEECKSYFFIEADGHTIFKLQDFIYFVQDKNFLSNSHTQYENKIGLSIGRNKLMKYHDEVVLNFPFKDCVLEGGQSKDDAKRKEIYFNDVLAKDEIDRLLDPKALSNFKRIDAEGEKAFDGFRRDEKGMIRDNLLVKGNNLLALHSLAEEFRGKVKLIYIDPPYNTGSSQDPFLYNNNFKRSLWLVFMKNRLEVAKNLLRGDGVLICAIDENEHVHLGVLLKEIFKEEKYEIHCITIVHNPRGTIGTNFSYTHEYAFFVLPKGKKSIGDREIEEDGRSWSNLRNWGGESLRTDARNCFYPIIVENGEVVGFGEVSLENEHPKQTEKKSNQYYIYPIDKQGIERKWRYARQSVEKVKHLLRVKRNEEGFEVEIGKDFGTYRTVWVDKRYDANEYGKKLIKNLVPNCPFAFPKSLYAVYDCFKAVIEDDPNAIVLDFFAGSGTTAHAVLELNKKDGGNRQFILVEQMDYIEEVTLARIQKVIKNNFEEKNNSLLKGEEDKTSFVYFELMKYNLFFVEQIEAAKTTEDLLNAWNAMKDKAFFVYNLEMMKHQDLIDSGEFAKLGLPKQKKLLIEILNANQLYLPATEMDDVSYEVSEADKKATREFYGK